MTESDPSHASDTHQGGLPADWALSRVAEAVSRASNLQVPQPDQPVAPRPPEPRAVTAQAAPKEPPAMRDVDPDIFGALGDWQERQALTQPRAREVLRPAEDNRYTPPPQYQAPFAQQPAAQPSQPLPTQAAMAAEPEAATDEAPARAKFTATGLAGSLRFWRGATIVFALISLGLLISSLNRPPRFDIAIAPIGVVNAPAPLFLAETAATRIRLTALADIEVPAANDLQLWMFAPNSDKPISLGVLPISGGVFTPAAPPVEGSRLVISLEPHGGSTGGKITGKVLYGGTLANR